MPFPPPRDLPKPGIEPMSPVAPALTGRFFFFFFFIVVDDRSILLPLSHLRSPVKLS